MGNVKKTKRIFYFDALRALAILSVIIIHVYSRSRGLITNEFGVIPSFNWLLTDFTMICFRMGVVLFLMLSGALSLGRVWDIKSFLGKRLPRIVAPFLFWGATLSLIVIIFSYYFNFNWIDPINVSSILNFIYHAYLFTSPTFGQYWFFWMILGTYFIMPIFNKWLLHSELTEAEYFLFFWLITCLFDYTLFIEFPIKLSYFTSPIGLVVLGYYLRHTQRKILNNPYFSIFLILMSCIVMMYVSYLNSSHNRIFVFDRYSILIAIEVIGVFTLFKNFNKLNISFNFLYDSDGIFRKFIGSLAKYSYGIYLVHNTVLVILYKLIDHSMNYKLLTTILLISSIFIPLFILALLNKIPYIKEVIGAK